MAKTISPELCLTRAELDAVIAQLPRCATSRSHLGENKRSFPVWAMAVAVAARQIGAKVYPCHSRSHYHVRSVAAATGDRYGSPYRVRKRSKWAALMEDARARALDQGERQHVYGERNEAGRWVYRSHKAKYREDVGR